MKWVDRLARLFAVLAGYALFAVAVFIAVGVGFRYLLGSPIFGAQDITQLILVPVTMFGMAYTFATGGHVAVDLFEGMLGRVGCLIGDVIGRVLGIAMLGLLLWGSIKKMRDALEWGDVTNLLQLPYWPFWALIIVSTALFALVVLLDLICVGRRRAALEGAQ